MFVKELRTAFGGSFAVKGHISPDVLSYFFIHLKDDYLRNGPYKAYELKSFTGYMGDKYWLLNNEVSFLPMQYRHRTSIYVFSIIAAFSQTCLALFLNLISLLQNHLITMKSYSMALGSGVLGCELTPVDTHGVNYQFLYNFL